MGGQAAKPPLALERYATLNAEIEAGEDLAAVLERESVAKELWLSAQAFWLARMAEEASGKRFETTTRYQALFNAKRKVFESRFERARKKRDRVPPKGPPIEVLAGANAELARPPHTSLPGLSFPEPPQVSPATARDPYPSAAGGSSAGGAGPTTARDVSPPFMAGAVPFVAHPPKPAFTNAQAEPPPPETHPPPQTQEAPPPRKHHATVSFELPAIAKPATPFAAAPSAPQGVAAPAAPPAVLAAQGIAPPVPIPPPLPAKRDLGSTWAAADDSPSIDVPFRKDAPVRPNETAPLPETLQRELRERLGVPAKRNLGATMMADSTFLNAEATPFKKASSAGLPAQRPLPPGRAGAPLPEPPKPVPLAADDDDDDSPRTKMVDPEAMARAVAQATPFANAGPQRSLSPPLAVPSAPTAPLPSGPGPNANKPDAASGGVKKFSINVFASLTAEIAENPGDAQNIRHRYGVSDSEHRAESGRWTAEFNHSEELRQRYLGIVQRYRGYIQQRKGG